MQATKFIIRLLILQFIFVSAAYAATFQVNSTLDEIDSNEGDGVCASAGGRCTLRAAVMEANALAGADTVLLPAGTFPLTLAGTSEQMAKTGDLDITEALTVKGDSSSTTIIEANLLDRIFELTAAEPCTFSDLTIMNGFTTDPGGALFNPFETLIVIQRVAFKNNFSVSTGGTIYSSGPLQVTDSLFEDNVADTAAGIFSSHGSPQGSSITNTTFKNNVSNSFHSAYFSGDAPVSITNIKVLDNIATNTGGLYFSLSTKSLDIADSTFSDNSSEGLGALYYSGDGDVTIKNSTFTRNELKNGGVGGALHVTTSGSSKFTLEDIEFEGNEASSGGADIYFSTSGNGLTSIKRITSNDAYCPDNGAACSAQIQGSSNDLVLEDFVIDNSFLGDGAGGAMYVSGFVNVTLRSLVISNSSMFNGTAGALYVTSNDTLLIEDGMFLGNRLFNSGAAGCMYISAGTALTLRRTSVLENQGYAPGATTGGAYISSPSILVENSTFSGNLGYINGGLFLSDPATIKNSTFYNNIGFVESSSIYASGDVHFANTIVAGSSDIDHCKTGGTFISDGHNLESTDTCNFNAAGDLINTDPELSALKDTPESDILVHVPLIGSPSIEGGNNATCLADDQRGVARPYDGDEDGSALCDIGAVEFNDFCPNDDLKQFPGVCGCGTADTDTDGDGTFDCNDSCALDPAKITPGACGCGVADTDVFFPENAIADCQSGNEIKTAATLLLEEVNKIKRVTSKTKKKKRKAIFKARKAARALYKSLLSFLETQASTVSVTSPDVSIASLSNKLKKRVRKLFNVKKVTGKKKKQAIKSIEALMSSVQ